MATNRLISRRSLHVSGNNAHKHVQFSLYDIQNGWGFGLSNADVVDHSLLIHLRSHDRQL